MFGVYWLKAISGWCLLRVRAKKVPKKGYSVVPFKIGCYLFSWCYLNGWRVSTGRCAANSCGLCASALSHPLHSNPIMLSFKAKLRLLFVAIDPSQSSYEPGEIQASYLSE